MYPAEGTFPVFLVFYVIATLAIAVSMVSMVADTVEYRQWQFGTRFEGLLSSGVTFATKVGSAIGSAAVAYGLAVAGYRPGEESGGVVTAIRVMFYGIPQLLAAQAVGMAFWDLDGRHEAMRADIDQTSTGRRGRPGHEAGGRGLVRSLLKRGARWFTCAAEFHATQT
ncbi:hypothetical protein SGFS_021640 [Streptomyces graminofaciens]|uniref:Uncharacterized protein n=1 Tax=Streptomyces graminofaciens TaxID=68212 RepID=A0ABM7F2M1_9ACTN|nr:MFS transporter [Streptomyces graminofaciens]BBC30870.1 hypothetical protein SGFS_021640 [Streptomyces graminofaciens]